MSLGSRDSISRDKGTLQLSRVECLRLRSRLTQAVRRFFVERDYLEVETPHLIPAPAPEVHIEVIAAGGLYLHPSPELCMKRLLARGHSRIFQIGRCFRAGERGNRNLPEFTLLEWYRTGIHYVELMEECEALFQHVCHSLHMDERVVYRGNDIDLRSPWERVSVEEAFSAHTAFTPLSALEAGCFDQILAEAIEPRLGTGRATFLFDYPAPLAALARLKEGDPGVAERFEIYIGGMEIANGFSELTDPQEQRSRFESDREKRKAAGKRVYPLPEPFLNDLEHIPEAAGIALGMDRLTMLFADAARIDDVVCFTPEEL